MSEKIYCGSGKVINWRYGEFIKLSIWPKDQQVIEKHRTEKGWVNIICSPRKEVWKYGETHSLTIDTYTGTKWINPDADSVTPIEDLWPGFN